MKKLLLSLFVSIICLGSMSCSRITDVLDNHLNYSKVTIKYNYTNCDYKNLKVVFGDNEYNAVGSYKVPKNTIMDISWDFKYYYDQNQWAHSSESVSIGAYENVIITIGGQKLSIQNI